MRKFLSNALAVLLAVTVMPYCVLWQDLFYPLIKKGRTDLTGGSELAVAISAVAVVIHFALAAIVLSFSSLIILLFK
jgi:hypothetical protein